MLRHKAVRLLVAGVTIATATTGCTKGDSEGLTPAWQDPGLGGLSLPALRLVFVSTDLASSPATVNAPAVGEDGALGFVADGAEALRIVVVDTTGKVLQRFGAPGEGPGEVRSPNVIGLTSSHVYVFDLGTNRLTRFSRHDSSAEDVPMEKGMILPFHLVDDTTAFAVAAGPDGGMPGLLNLRSGRLTPLMNPEDDFIIATTKELEPIGRRPTTGWWGGGLVVANAMSYSLVLYGIDKEPAGRIDRDVSPPRPTAARVDAELDALVKSPVGRNWSESEVARRREERLNENIGHFRVRPFRVDGAGRMWVVGPSGDSAYADVFAGERFLGRLEIGCRGSNGGYAVSGHWLAMSCEPQDPDFPGDAVVQLYRIEEPQ
jgi:hypothetical protein